MPVLTNNGYVISRKEVYLKSAIQKNRKKSIASKKIQNFQATKKLHAISEKQAKLIIDGRIARRLRQMYC